ENNRYLAASLEWLRLRLEKLAPVPAPGAEVESAPAFEPVKPALAPEPGVFQRWLHRGEHEGEAEVKHVPLLPEAKPPSLDDQIASAAGKRKAAADIDPPPALAMLAQRFGMSDFERDTLLLCASVEFDPAMAALCGVAQNNPARSYPTFGLALLAFDDAS